MSITVKKIRIAEVTAPPQGGPSQAGPCPSMFPIRCRG
jgi:hypothetical protein